MFVKAASGIRLPIPPSLGLGLRGVFPEDKAVRVQPSRFIRRRMAEGSLVECRNLEGAPVKPPRPDAPPRPPRRPRPATTTPEVPASDSVPPNAGRSTTDPNPRS